MLQYQFKVALHLYRDHLFVILRILSVVSKIVRPSIKFLMLNLNIIRNLFCSRAQEFYVLCKSHLPYIKAISTNILRIINVDLSVDVVKVIKVDILKLSWIIRLKMHLTLITHLMSICVQFIIISFIISF